MSYKGVIDAFTGRILGGKRMRGGNTIGAEQQRGEIAQLMSKGGTTTLQPFMNDLINKGRGRVSREAAYMAAMNAFQNLYPQMVGEVNMFGLPQKQEPRKVPSPKTILQGFFNNAEPILGSFKGGTPRVQKTGLYRLHEGEAVIPSNINNELAALMREQVGVERDQRIKEREAKAVMKQLADALMGNSSASTGGTMDLTGAGTNTETGVGTLAEGIGDPNTPNYAPAGQEMLMARGLPDMPTEAPAGPTDGSMTPESIAKAKMLAMQLGITANPEVKGLLDMASSTVPKLEGTAAAAKAAFPDLPLAEAVRKYNQLNDRDRTQLVQTDKGWVEYNKDTREIRPIGIRKPMTSEQQDTMEKIQSLRETADEIKNLYFKEGTGGELIPKEGSESMTGPIQGRMGWVREKTGLGLEGKEGAFRAKTASLFRMVYALSGKQINEKELQKLEPFMPGTNDSDPMFAYKTKNFLHELDRIIENKKKLYAGDYGKMPDVPNQSTATVNPLEAEMKRRGLL